uniref:Signal recognition particle subunit SRP72 n=3 Tax=Passeriformes TaxID=9126 RepID=H0Z301_TAEGU
MDQDPQLPFCSAAPQPLVPQCIHTTGAAGCRTRADPGTRHSPRREAARPGHTAFPAAGSCAAQAHGIPSGGKLRSAGTRHSQRREAVQRRHTAFPAAGSCAARAHGIPSGGKLRGPGTRHSQRREAVQLRHTHSARGGAGQGGAAGTARTPVGGGAPLGTSASGAAPPPRRVSGPGAKMAAAAGVAAAAGLWSEVNRCGQNGDFARALKSVNKILQINKDDVTALQCKVVCLIQNGNFKEALGVINTHTKVLTSDVIAFEKAYCEYRLNRIESALKTIQSASQQTDKLKELYGQVLYRLERYDDCLAAYRDLIRNSQDEYEEERKTNLSAVVAAQSTWEKVVPEDLGLREATYELCYNSACALIGQGKLNEAMKKLQKAEELCRQSLSEDSDVTEEDIEAELAIIHGQMAYIMQLQGRTEDALQLYNQIIKLKPTDVGLLAVIANNIITINKDQNVFDSKKKVKLTNAEGVEHKLSKKQLQAIEFNKALLAMYTNQADQCRKLSASLQSQSPEHLLPVLIQAAQLCREKQHAKAVGLLQDFADQHPANAAEIKLTMAQLKIAQGSVTKACMILRSIEELQHKPGMVSALVTMYSHEEDIDSAIEVFTQAIQWYQQHQPKSPVHLSLIREAANFKLKHGRKKEAISDLEELWKQNPKDVHTLAQLISAYSLVDPEKAKVLSKHLPSSDTMSLKVDVDALENSHGATYVRKKAGKLTGDNQQKEQGQGEVKKKKKKKKGKLPKNYDPKVTPDPERWLPMRERSYYRGRKKGKKKDQVGKGTQGSTTTGSSELDASRTASSPPTSPRPGSGAAVSATSNVIPPRHQKPAGAPATKKKQQQKKKKGAKGGW